MAIKQIVISDSVKQLYVPEACQNTEREIWREKPDDYYAASISVNDLGRIFIQVGGAVYGMSVQQWHSLASQTLKPGANEVKEGE